eukprot:scaffold52186_cov29-Tisochrysis_lutea.AAC.3
MAGGQGNGKGVAGTTAARARNGGLAIAEAKNGPSCADGPARGTAAGGGVTLEPVESRRLASGRHSRTKKSYAAPSESSQMSDRTSSIPRGGPADPKANSRSDSIGTPKHNESVAGWLGAAASIGADVVERGDCAPGVRDPGVLESTEGEACRASADPSNAASHRNPSESSLMKIPTNKPFVTKSRA